MIAIGTAGLAAVASGDDAPAPAQPPAESPGQTQGQTPAPAPGQTPAPAPGQTPGQGRWQGHHGAMMQAAQSACASAKEGATCSFQGRRGTHEGTCKTMNQVLACAPNDVRGAGMGHFGGFGQGAMGSNGGRHF
jgi:hypothetical protein